MFYLFLRERVRVGKGQREVQRIQSRLRAGLELRNCEITT